MKKIKVLITLLIMVPVFSLAGETFNGSFSLSKSAVDTGNDPAIKKKVTGVAVLPVGNVKRNATPPAGGAAANPAAIPPAGQKPSVYGRVNQKDFDELNRQQTSANAQTSKAAPANGGGIYSSSSLIKKDDPTRIPLPVVGNKGNLYESTGGALDNSSSGGKLPIGSKESDYPKTPRDKQYTNLPPEGGSSNSNANAQPANHLKLPSSPVPANQPVNNTNNVSTNNTPPVNQQRLAGPPAQVANTTTNQPNAALSKPAASTVANPAPQQNGANQGGLKLPPPPPPFVNNSAAPPQVIKTNAPLPPPITGANTAQNSQPAAANPLPQQTNVANQGGLKLPPPIPANAAVPVTKSAANAGAVQYSQLPANQQNNNLKQQPGNNSQVQYSALPVQQNQNISQQSAQLGLPANAAPASQNVKPPVGQSAAPSAALKATSQQTTGQNVPAASGKLNYGKLPPEPVKTNAAQSSAVPAGAKPVANSGDAKYAPIAITKKEVVPPEPVSSKNNNAVQNNAAVKKTSAPPPVQQVKGSPAPVNNNKVAPKPVAPKSKGKN